MRRHLLKLLTFCLATLLLGSVDCIFSARCAYAWEWPSFISTPDPPGTPGWWKKHKRQAEFVPREGFRVAGFEGFYDQEGRPIKTQVAKVVKREKDKGLLKQANVEEAMADVKRQVGLGPDEELARQAYAAGEDLFRREEYSAAAKQFKQTIARWPDSALEQDAMFFLAESGFYADDYPSAIEGYQTLLKKSPNSPHLDKAVRRQFEIARFWEKQHTHDPHWATTPNLLDSTRPLFDTLGRAMKVYENIRLNDPTGPLADDAIMATANSLFVRGRYVDADYQYELIRQEYPRSEHQFEAHILGLQCKLRKYQGADYDDTPLIEAKKLVKQLKAQFAGELDPQQRERLATDEGRLNLQLAQRDYVRAEYYDNIEQYGSAKFYYRQLATRYPDTPLAEKSRERYIALGGKPERPSSMMQPLLDMLPENAERKAIAQVPLLDTPSDIRIATQPKIDDSTAAPTIRR